MIFTKSTFSKKVLKNIDFGSIFRSKNAKIRCKIALKNMFFFQHRFLSVFFPDFDDLGSIFGGLGPSKNLKKLRKIDSNLVSGRIWNAFEISIRCWSNLGRFGMDFGRILEWFLLILFAGLEGTSISETFQVEGLISMIRATRGRSMDGWMEKT